MKTQSLPTLLIAAVLGVGVAGLARAPEPAAAPAAQSIAKTACGTPVGAPAALPHAGVQPFIWTLELCFDRQCNTSTVENETYLYWIKLPVSLPSPGKFVPYDEAA